eukprot:TRINITY_DN12962_c0_g1_i1.p2 TRINITY_DN12962_c0_g1~~TRINITY_DN12962_c0_g1_i1.p2  ORF type:complete len:248 (+),score=82.96 TRINITY_DN12962_c0_g1_i1:224-967(+)
MDLAKMDIGLSSAGSKRARTEDAESGDKDKEKKQQTQQQRGRGKGNADVDQLLAHVARLTLINTREVATVKSAVAVVATFSKEEALGKEITEVTKAAMQNYSQIAKDAEAKQDLDPPHAYVFFELVKVTLLAAQAGNWQQKDALMTYFTQLDKLALRAMQEQDIKDKAKAIRMVIMEEVKIAKVTKCYAPHLSRVELAASGDADKVIKPLLACLCQHAKGQIKRGSAPRNDLERKIAKLLEGRAGKH